MNAKKNSTFTKRAMESKYPHQAGTDISPSAENTCVKLNEWQLTFFRREMIATPAAKSDWYHTEIVDWLYISESMYWHATEEDTQVLQIHK